MDAEQAKAFFKRADDLYNAGQFTDALRILAELNKAFPNQKNVIWPSALCLGKLGRHEEAIRACDILVAQHGDVRAADLRERLAAHRQGTVTPPPLPRADMLDGPIGLDAIDAMLDRPDPPARVARKAETDYKKWGLISGGIVLVLLLVLVPIMVGGQRPTSPLANTVQTSVEEFGDATEEDGTPVFTPEEQEAIDQISRGVGVGAVAAETVWRTMVLVTIAASLFAYALAMYCTFSILGKLPFSEFSDNAADILLYAIIFTALGFIPLFGFIASLVIMSKHYQLSCGELAISYIVITVLAIGFMFVGIMITGASIAGTVALAT